MLSAPTKAVYPPRRLVEIPQVEMQVNDVSVYLPNGHPQRITKPSVAFRSARSGLLVLVIALTWLAAGPSTALASNVTLDFSGTLMSQPATVGSPATTCSSSGCTMVGSLVFDGTTGAVVSEDFTVSGETPVVGPFTVAYYAIYQNGYTFLQVDDNSSDRLVLYVPTPHVGSLVGYTGGYVQTGGYSYIFNRNTFADWILTSGQFTDPSKVPTVPEPSSLLLMTPALGLACILFRKRLLSN